MQFTIERIPLSELSYEKFREAYHDVPSPQPLLITGVPVPEEKLSVEEFSHRYIAGAVKSLAWYDAPISDDPLFPSLAKTLLTASDIAVRPMPLRVWAHPKGHKTLLHYDGNSLSSFNLQLRGSKRWLLISPDTPLPMPPLQFVCLAGPDYFPTPRKYEYCEFETKPGEMLFLPRYWTHGVESLGEVNLNLNWVWTPRWPCKTKNGKRESELLALRSSFRLLNHLSGDDLNSYGGDADIISAYVDGISRSAMARRALRELAMIPKMLWHLRNVLSQVRTFENNNFNVNEH